MEDGGAEALPEIDSHPACTSPERKQKNDIKGQNETKHLNFEFYGLDSPTQIDRDVHRLS